MFFGNLTLTLTKKKSLPPSGEGEGSGELEAKILADIEIAKQKIAATKSASFFSTLGWSTASSTEAVPNTSPSITSATTRYS